MESSVLEKKSLDLTTCCVCLKSYDQKENEPKLLPCADTFCLKCIMATDCFTCPVCKKVCELSPAAASNLPTNLHALHIVQLKNQYKEKQSWCLTCEALVKPSCQLKCHNIYDSLRDLAEFQLNLNQALDDLSNGDEIVGQLIENLHAKITVLEAEIEVNSGIRQKIRSAITSCQEMGQLSPAVKASSFIKEELKQKMKEAKEELKRAQHLQQISPLNQKETVELTMIDEESNSRKSVKRTSIDLNKNGSHESIFQKPTKMRRFSDAFSAKCLSVHRKEADASSSFHCKDLLGHNGGIAVIEFSEDGTLLASGGKDKIVRLWPISKEAENGNNLDITPIEMETLHESFISCLAISSDNRRLFSGCKEKLVVLDIETYKLMDSIEHPPKLRNISLQHSSGGNIFALACNDDILRIYDIRNSTSQPVLQSTQPPGSNVCCVMFSPAEPTIVAVGGIGGTRILDIRFDPVRCCHSYDTMAFTLSVMFDDKGTRLLSREKDNISLLSYNLSTDGVQQNQTGAEMDKVLQLSSPGYAVPKKGINVYCFAGEDDELIVASSVGDHSLHIWSIPDGGLANEENRTFKQSLLTLLGHQKPLESVRYSKAISTLASCGNENVIKLWTPTN